MYSSRYLCANSVLIREKFIDVHTHVIVPLLRIYDTVFTEKRQLLNFKIFVEPIQSMFGRSGITTMGHCLYFYEL
jgi:hypothetical protein